MRACGKRAPDARWKVGATEVFVDEFSWSGVIHSAYTHGWVLAEYWGLPLTNFFPTVFPG